MAYRGGFGGFGGGGMGNMQNLMKQAQKMQEEMQKAQAELEETEVEGTSGGGLIKVTVTAKGGKEHFHRQKRRRYRRPYDVRRPYHRRAQRRLR